MAETDQVFHNFSEGTTQGSSSTKAFFIFVIVIIIGVGIGYMLAKGKTKVVPSSSTNQDQSGSTATKGTVVGSNDTSTFKDEAEGVLQKGGVNGEGQYHLVRPGGDSQSVYLTSSIIDLSQFVGKKVKVNGQTQKAKTAGWLMDVGRVEVLE
jgi:hypothetical protein